MTHSYGYLWDVLRGAESWLADAERHVKIDPKLGNVLEHVRAAKRQVHAAQEMVPGKHPQRRNEKGGQHGEDQRAVR